MVLRLVGVAIGAHTALVAAVVGVVVAQVIATASIGVAGWLAFRRFPQRCRRASGEDRRGILALRRSVEPRDRRRSRCAAGLAPLLSSASSPIDQVGYLPERAGAATGFAALSAPARLVMLTEQTRDFERGRQSRRASAGCAATCAGRRC